MIPNFEKKLTDFNNSVSDDDDIELQLDNNDSMNMDIDYDSVSEYEEEDQDINVLEVSEQIDYLRSKYTEEQINEKKQKLFEKKYMELLFKNIQEKLSKIRNDSVYRLTKIYE